MKVHGDELASNPYTSRPVQPPNADYTTGLMSDFPEDFLEMEVNFSTPQEVATHLRGST